MKELITDYWSMLLPEEWHAEQDEDSVFIVDEDEVSVVEISAILPESGLVTKDLVLRLSSNHSEKRMLAGIDAVFRSFDEDGMVWREWICNAKNSVLVISHGCDSEHKGFDDAAVDEMLATVVISGEENQ